MKRGKPVDKIIAFLCVFMYYMSPYRFMGHAMPEVIGLVAILLQLTQSHKIRVLTGFGAFMIYMLFVPSVISFITGLPGDYLTSFVPFNLLFYSAAFCILIPNVDMEYVIKYYGVLVYIAVAFFFVQEIFEFITGSRPTLYLPLEMYYEGSDAAGLSESRASLSRSSSFFLEPAHFAQYILPYYCLAICKCLRGKAMSIELIVLSFALVFLQSGCGYLGLASIFGAILFIKGFVPFKVKLAIISTFIIGLGFVAVFLYDNPIIIDILSRFDEITTIDIISDGRESGFLRIWRGYYFYGAMAPINKLLGVGVGSIEYVSNLVYFPGSRYEGSYMNGIQSLLVTGGIVGTALFFRFLYKIGKKMEVEGVIMLICMIALFFVEHMLFTPKMFLFILIAYAITELSRNQDVVNNTINDESFNFKQRIRLTHGCHYQ